MSHSVCECVSVVLLDVNTQTCALSNGGRQEIGGAQRPVHVMPVTTMTLEGRHMDMEGAMPEEIQSAGFLYGAFCCLHPY